MHTSISTILDKLANDDAFRARLLSEPLAALASIGVTLRADQLPAQRSLASRETLAADQNAYQAKLETVQAMWPFLLSGSAT